MTDLLTQKNTKGVNFQSKKLRRTPLSCILEVFPPGAYCVAFYDNTLVSHHLTFHLAV